MFADSDSKAFSVVARTNIDTHFLLSSINLEPVIHPLLRLTLFFIDMKQHLDQFKSYVQGLVQRRPHLSPYPVHVNVLSMLFNATRVKIGFAFMR